MLILLAVVEAVPATLSGGPNSMHCNLEQELDLESHMQSRLMGLIASTDVSKAAIEEQNVCCRQFTACQSASTYSHACSLADQAYKDLDRERFAQYVP